MKVIIIGGERVPYFLAKKLIAKGYDVFFVNKDIELCKEYSRTLNAEIINGDGTSKAVLDQLQIEGDDLVVLLMERDRKNFFIARMVQEYYGVKNVVTLLNNTENEDLFQKFGIRILKVTDLIMSNIELLLFENEVVESLESEVSSKGAIVLKIDIDWEAKILRKNIRDINVPEGIIIVGIVRGSEFIIPRGETTIEPGDKLIIVCNKEKKEQAVELFSF